MLYSNISDENYPCLLHDSQSFRVIVIRSDFFFYYYIYSNFYVTFYFLLAFLLYNAFYCFFSTRYTCILDWRLNWFMLYFLFFYKAAYPSTGRCYWWRTCSRYRRCGGRKYCDYTHYRYGKTGICCSICTFILFITL